MSYFHDLLTEGATNFYTWDILLALLTIILLISSREFKNGIELKYEG
jgi:hypothetical protein